VWVTLPRRNVFRDIYPAFMVVEEVQRSRQDGVLERFAFVTCIIPCFETYI